MHSDITAAARVCSERLLPISMQLHPPRHMIPAVSSTVCLPNVQVNIHIRSADLEA